MFCSHEYDEQLSVPSFIKIVQAIKKVKFNLPSVIELSETAVFVYNFV